MSNNTISNLFDDYNRHRKHTTRMWAPTDSEERYLPMNSGQPNFTTTEITYTFNEYGFRSDSFSDTADLSILFMGCSFTEGIGLPLDQAWPNYLLAKIKEQPQFSDKNIPYYSVAVGGSGLDSQARYLRNHIDKIKPSHIFLLVPSLHRREYCYDATFATWMPNHESGQHPDVINRVLSDDSFAIHESFKSLALIEALAKQYNCIVHMVNWFGSMANQHAPELFKQFPSSHVIDTQSKMHTPIGPEFLPKAYQAALARPFNARDNAHAGVRWHYNLASEIWDASKHLITLPPPPPAPISVSTPTIQQKSPIVYTSNRDIHRPK